MGMAFFFMITVIVVVAVVFFMVFFSVLVGVAVGVVAVVSAGGRRRGRAVPGQDHERAHHVVVLVFQHVAVPHEPSHVSLPWLTVRRRRSKDDEAKRRRKKRVQGSGQEWW